MSTIAAQAPRLKDMRLRIPEELLEKLRVHAPHSLAVSERNGHTRLVIFGLEEAVKALEAKKQRPSSSRN